MRRSAVAKRQAKATLPAVLRIKVACGAGLLPASRPAVSAFDSSVPVFVIIVPPSLLDFMSKKVRALDVSKRQIGARAQSARPSHVEANLDPGRFGWAAAVVGIGVNTDRSVLKPASSQRRAARTPRPETGPLHFDFQRLDAVFLGFLANIFCGI